MGRPHQYIFFIYMNLFFRLYIYTSKKRIRLQEKLVIFRFY